MPAGRPIPVAKPTLGDEEVEAVRGAILSGWVTQGPRVKAFEDAFARHAGAPYACAVSNCTAALHLALLDVGTRPGDVVITASHSFIATANAIRHCQAEPVFVDIDFDTLNIHPDLLAECLANDFDERDGALWYRHCHRFSTGDSPLTGRTTAVGRLAALLVVHQVGMPADLPALLQLARRHRIPVVEDAACAVGSEVSLDGGLTWEPIGRPHGDIACFSFHPRKVITTGDGGMLTTASAEHDRQFRLLRQHGMDTPDYVRHRSEQLIVESYLITGFNYRLTDVQAAIGLCQLGRLPQLVARRRELASLYSERLSAIPRITTPTEPRSARSNWQSYVIKVDDGVSTVQVMQSLKARAIDTRPGVMCAHREAPYARAWPKGCLPASERAQDHSIVLPLYPEMTAEDVGRVTDELARVT